MSKEGTKIKKTLLSPRKHDKSENVDSNELTPSLENTSPNGTKQKRNRVSFAGNSESPKEKKTQTSPRKALAKAHTSLGLLPRKRSLSEPPKYELKLSKDTGDIKETKKEKKIDKKKKKKDGKSNDSGKSKDKVKSKQKSKDKSKSTKELKLSRSSKSLSKSDKTPKIKKTKKSKDKFQVELKNELTKLPKKKKKTSGSAISPVLGSKKKKKKSKSSISILPSGPSKLAQSVVVELISPRPRSASANSSDDMFGSDVTSPPTHLPPSPLQRTHNNSRLVESRFKKRRSFHPSNFSKRSSVYFNINALIPTINSPSNETPQWVLFTLKFLKSSLDIDSNIEEISCILKKFFSSQQDTTTSAVVNDANSTLKKKLDSGKGFNFGEEKFGDIVTVLFDYLLKQDTTALNFDNPKFFTSLETAMDITLPWFQTSTVHSLLYKLDKIHRNFILEFIHFFGKFLEKFNEMNKTKSPSSQSSPLRSSLSPYAPPSLSINRSSSSGAVSPRAVSPRISKLAQNFTKDSTLPAGDSGIQNQPTPTTNSPSHAPPLQHTGSTPVRTKQITSRKIATLFLKCFWKEPTSKPTSAPPSNNTGTNVSSNSDVKSGTSKYIHILESLITGYLDILKIDQNSSYYVQDSNENSSTSISNTSNLNASTNTPSEKGLFSTPFSNFITSHVYTGEPNDYVIKSATMDILINKMLDFNYSDKLDLEEIIVLTHSYFIDSVEFLNLLIKKFNDFLPVGKKKDANINDFIVSRKVSQNGIGPKSGTKISSKIEEMKMTDWRYCVRIGTLNFFKKWIFNIHHDFLKNTKLNPNGFNLFLDTLNDFIDSHYEPQDVKDIDKIPGIPEWDLGGSSAQIPTRTKLKISNFQKDETLLFESLKGIVLSLKGKQENNQSNQTEIQNSENIDISTNNNQTSNQTDAGTSTSNSRSNSILSGIKTSVSEILEMYNAKDTAEQLTLLDNNSFKAITKQELLHKHFLDPKKAPFFAKMVNRGNGLGLWIASCIVKEKEIDKRCTVISYFIEVCVRCRQLNNFNGVFEVLDGLTNTAVSRLKKTWNKLGNKDKRRLKMVKRDVFDTDRNFHNYRAILLKTDPPLVPYLALLSKDLYSIEEGNPTFVDRIPGGAGEEEEEEKEKIINIEKMRMLWKVCEKVKSYRRSYDIKENTVFKHMFDTEVNLCEALDERQLFEWSYEIEEKTQIKGTRGSSRLVTTSTNKKSDDAGKSSATKNTEECSCKNSDETNSCDEIDECDKECMKNENDKKEILPT